MAESIDISLARKDFHKLGNRLGEPPVLRVVRHGKPVFAIIDPAYLDALLETVDVLSDPEAAEMLEESIRDIRAGRVVAHEDLEDEFG